MIHRPHTHQRGQEKRSLHDNCQHVVLYALVALVTGQHKGALLAHQSGVIAPKDVFCCLASKFECCTLDGQGRSPIS